MTDFQLLYERYAGAVRRFALCLSGDPSLADDITSETFVRVLTSGGEIRQDTVKAYLFTIARNLHRDSVRASRRRDALREHMEDTRPGVARRVEARSELELVLAAIDALPPIDKAALVMRAFDGFSYEEIARVLGISLAAAKVKIHRARRRLLDARDARDVNSEASTS